MDQFVPADWSSGKMGDTFAPSCDQEDGLVELLWCRSHVAMHSQLPPPRPTAREHEAEPCFQYPVDEDPLDKDLFWKFFGEMPAEGTCRLARSDTAGYSVATPYHDASKMVTSSSTRPRAPGGVKRKQRDTAGGEIPSEVMQDAGESDSAADAAMTCGRTKGKRRRAAQEHNLSERRRRDRINEKMRALQQLVPHCNKTDKASMLDEAIRYLTSLQLQVKMMWTTGAGMGARERRPLVHAAYTVV